MHSVLSANITRLDLDSFGGLTRHDAGPQAQVGDENVSLRPAERLLRPADRD